MEVVVKMGNITKELQKLLKDYNKNLIALITHELQLEKQRRSNLELEVADLRSELETMRDNLSGNTN